MKKNCCSQLSDWFMGTFMAYMCPELGAGQKYSPTHEGISARQRADGDSAENVVPPSDLSNDRLTMMVVKHSFVADDGEELQVEAGQIVYATHEENQWVYALTESGEHGFVPSNFLARVDSSRMKTTRTGRRPHRHLHRASPVETSSADTDCTRVVSGKQNELQSKLTKSLSFGEVELGDFDIFGYISDTSFHHSESSEQSLNGSDYSAVVEPFSRTPCGKYLVLHNYHGEDENDATILKGDCVTVLNKDDYDWYYIQTSDGTEGFVPRSYLWQATCAPDDDVIL